MSKILFVVNAPEFFLSHRLPIALAALASGYDVHVATANGESVSKINDLGLVHHLIPMERSGQNPFKEIVSIFKLFRLFRQIKPDLVHLITIKPVLYGGFAARLARVPATVAAVSGLGTVFMDGSVKSNVRRWLVFKLYRVALNHKRLKVIFQNPDDRKALLDLRVLEPDFACMIRGSGVDLNDYPFVDEPEETKLIVVMAARLLRDKGVFEFIQAAKLLKERESMVTMRLIGSPDPGNPSSISQQDIDNWSSNDFVEILGFRTDIAYQYAAANIVCLPSYREGLPKGLVEAAACGRAVVTTDVPGCRDAISPDITGVLVPVRDSNALADAIQALLESPEKRMKMGAAGRKLAEEVFTIEKIVDLHMNIYRELLVDV